MLPHLPTQPVRQLLIGECWKSLLEDPLSKRGIRLESLPSNLKLAVPVRGHIDLLIQPVGENIWVAEPDSFPQAKMKFPCLSVLRGSKRLSEKYPKDIAYNGLRIGNHFFHNLKQTDSVVLEQLKKQGVILHSVKQGYAKCAVCPITEASAITADAGLAKALRLAGIDVLQITPGNISLPGYDTGLIGGSAFLIAPNCLAFTGNFFRHPDAEKIVRFLETYQIQTDILTDLPLFDIGSALILE